MVVLILTRKWTWLMQEELLARFVEAGTVWIKIAAKDIAMVGGYANLNPGGS